MDFIRKLEENSIQFSEQKAVSDGVNSYTYAELWELSGKIYRELKERGIGREDMVMVNLPRRAETIIVCVGVWRAGAAYVIYEESDLISRRDFIYEDCACKLRIDKAVYQSMLASDTLLGYESVFDHDLAYACYTSGTTGNPKGAMHEFGAIEQCRYSYFYEDKYELLSTDKYAMLSPLNFVAVIIVFPSLMYVGGELMIVPLSIVKNTEALKEFFASEKITVTFVTPTFTKVFHEFNEELRVLYLASEPAKNIYFDKLELYNVHAQSETGFLTTTFLIDKPYDMTPIGKTFIPDLGLKLLNEDGSEASQGEMGELCFQNIYFRGYIHHEELTQEVFRDGIYHTGDMGRMLPDGNIVLLGRVDDMVKINGNRVEPAEIETVLREIMQVDWVAIKCVKNEERVFVVAYYLDEPGCSINRVKAAVSQRLPYYMVPSYYMQIDSIPVNANGKFTRKNLPDPDFNREAAYVAPTDMLETGLTQVFGSVLENAAIGIDDDFYELGGDSLKCIEIVSLLDLPALTVEVIFKERTIRKIADFLRKELLRDEADESVESAIQLSMEGCKLAPFQRYFMDREHYAAKGQATSMYNLPVLMRYGKEIDVEKLRDAVQKTVHVHPLLSSKVYQGEDKELSQKLEAAFEEQINIEKITEKELLVKKDSLVQPFQHLEHRLCQVRIFQTEAYSYLFLNVHHMIADGFSLHVFFEDVCKAYQGEQLEYDAIYLYLKHVEKAVHEPDYEDSKYYYKSLYDEVHWSRLPKRDHEVKDYQLASFETELLFDDKNYQALKEKYFVNQNALYITATLLAMAKYNGASDVMATWTYHGRDAKQKSNMIGPLIKDLPVAIRLQNEQTLGDVFKDVNEQIQGGIAHSSYPYTLLSDHSYANDSLCFLYQMDVYDFESGDRLNGTQIEALSAEARKADNSFNIQIIKKETGYLLTIDYLQDAYEKESIEKFAKIYQQIVASIFAQENQLMGYVLNEENVMLSKI